jgi:hypothetical protein
MRHEPAQHTALFHAPEIPLLAGLWTAALARDDEHVAVPLGLAAGQEVAKRGIGVLLAHAVQVEPGAYFAAAAGDAFGGARVERLGLRRAARLPVGGC